MHTYNPSAVKAQTASSLGPTGQTSKRLCLKKQDG